MNENDLRTELELLALSDATSGRARQAKVTAIRTLQRLRPPPETYPTDDDGRFHPGPREMWDLDRCDSDELRERWRARPSH